MSTQPERISAETTRPDEVLREQLEQLLPGAVTDGVLDAQRLADLLGVSIAGLQDRPDRFGLNWAGKKSAIKALQSTSRAALAPDLENSVDWDTAQNVFIEGDNLEVLKLLQKAYNDKVKLIYIDPPYNTGNDFVYNDDFSDSAQHYLEVTGQVDGEGNRLVANTEVSGRKHSNWLNMMYSRLSLARNLLTDDGYLFLSISDVEHANVYALLCEIFGEENFIDTFIWNSIFRPSNLSKTVRRNAEYVLCFARNGSRDISMVERYQEPQGEASLTQNNNKPRTLLFPANVVRTGLPDGVYPAGEFESIALLDEVEVSSGQVISSFRLQGRFKWSQDYLESEIAKGVTLIIKSLSFIPYYRKDYQQTALTPTKLIPSDVVGDVLAANAEVSKILGEPLFSYPKPTSLINFVMRIADVGKEDIVLDFFAGSGTTGHAVALQNQADGGRCRSVLVNIPEPTAEKSAAREAGIETVSEITRMRLHKVMETVPGAREQGLRALRLNKSSFVDTTPTGEGSSLLLFKETLDPFASDDAIATEALLKSGVMLDKPWARQQVEGTPVVISDGVAISLARRVSEKLIASLCEVDAHTIVFLEDAFSGHDDVKANAFYAFQRANKTMKTM